MARPGSMVGRKSHRAASEPPRPSARPKRSARPSRSVRRDPPGPPLLPLLLVPVLATLGVTLLRLAGELMEWSPRLFSRVAGGGLAVVGIAWLVPIVGFYLGYRLGRTGLRPWSLARAAGLPGAALVLAPILAWLGSRLDSASTATGHLVVWGVVSAIVASLAFLAWPALGRVLVVYAFAARLPVVAVMWLAIRGDWGTHYDAPPPGFPSMPPDPRWLWTGVLPQMTIWVAWTLVVGALAGALGWLVASRRTD
jgi:hypothetical protein